MSKQELLDLIATPGSHTDATLKVKFSTLLDSYKDEAGVNALTDPLFKIGALLYGYTPTTSTSTSTSTSPAPAKSSDCIIPFDYMTSFMYDTFLSYGVSPSNAKICADVLIEADKRGIDSHGIGRLKPIYCDRMDKGILWPDKPIDVVKETDCLAVVDGNLGIGLYIGPKCMEIAIQKAKKHGVGFVVAQNSTHYGIAGYYATMATDAGCIGFTGTNARPSIAPTHGVEPMLGTNPLCFGIPTDDEFPFVIDCATSVNQRGKIERYAREGKDTPKGCVIDNDGIERTDTEGILKDMVQGKCALTPLGGAGEDMGGYKGYGWATTVELLCTAFQSGPFGEDVCGIDRKTGKPKPMPLGHFFLAIDIEPLCGLDTFKENAGKLVNALRESKKAPNGGGRIFTAGEKEHVARGERFGQGGLTVPVSLQKNMADLRDKQESLKTKYAKLPFEE
ncbi:hypothetical protein TrST_g2398 [Triparma strigata]|uniref:Malate dehydrogenase n=1 Tax=Triparma strigata TaxID=1606541 RepID=A0A9W7AS27_9STRA|nr:hypothetical protein TrST_g2398 [Triparma strigata]